MCDYCDAEIRRFCVAVQKRVLDGIVDREVEKGEQVASSPGSAPFVHDCCMIFILGSSMQGEPRD